MANTAIGPYIGRNNRQPLWLVIVAVLFHLEYTQSDENENEVAIQSQGHSYQVIDCLAFLDAIYSQEKATYLHSTIETATNNRRACVAALKPRTPTTSLASSGTLTVKQGLAVDRLEDWVVHAVVGQLHGRLNTAALSLLSRRLHKCLVLSRTVGDVLRRLIMIKRQFYALNCKGANIPFQHLEKRECQQLIRSAARICGKSNTARRLANLLLRKKASMDRALAVVLADI